MMGNVRAMGGEEGRHRGAEGAEKREVGAQPRPTPKTHTQNRRVGHPGKTRSNPTAQAEAYATGWRRFLWGWGGIRWRERIREMSALTPVVNDPATGRGPFRAPRGT